MGTWIANQKSIPVFEDDACTRCGMELPSGTLFCPQCGPPDPPDETPKESMGVGSAVLSIALILGLFTGVWFYKAEKAVEETQTSGTLNEETQLPIEPGSRPSDKDFHLVHYIKVPFANMREEASTSSEVITVLKRGEEVELVSKGNSWSQIKVGDQTGWMASHLLDTRVE